MEDFSYKTRTQGAVGSERMQLLSIIAHYWDELERYENEGGTQRQKWDLWETIASEFNNHPSVSVIRTPLQVKTLFKNMKTKARKYRLRLDESKASGVIIEPDPISETVLKLNKYQSRESLMAVLEPLKNLYYLSRKTSIPLPVLSEDDQGNSFVLNSTVSSVSSELTKVAPDETVPNFSEERSDEVLDNPCIVSEGSPSFLSRNKENFQSEDSAHRDSSKPLSNAIESSQVHTFGDISVTPISSEKNDPPFRIKILSPGFRGAENSLEVSSDNSDNSVNIEVLRNSKKVLPQRTNPLKRPLSSPEDESQQDPQKEAFCPHNQHNSYSHSLPGKCDAEWRCCCPEYHNEMLSMALKEHEMRIALLTEEILCQRAERSLYEEERRIREQNFLFKQEERQDAIAEHQARMKVTELECEVLEARIKNNERSNKWLLWNGSKEI